MRLSIFNIEKMIKVMIVIVVIVMYSLSIHFIPLYDETMDQWHTNVYKSQEFIFSDLYYKAILVGSSEINRLPYYDKEESIYNLGLAGDSTMTGLELIKKKEKCADYIFVEINDTILRGKNTEILNNEINSLNRFIRVRNRPDFLLYSAFRNVYENTIEQYIGYDINETNTSLLSEAQKRYDIVQNKDEIIEALLILKEDLSTLNELGYQIVLVELPCDSSLYNSKEMLTFRKLAIQVLADEEYVWLSDNWENYITTDGIHLTDMSANKFYNYILDFLHNNKENN